MKYPISPQAENIPAADGTTDWVLRVGIEYVNNDNIPMIQFWIMQPARMHKPNNGSLILVAADTIGSRLTESTFTGKNQKFGDPRWLHLQGLDSAHTQVSIAYPNSVSTEKITVKTEDLQTVTNRYVEMIFLIR